MARPRRTKRKRKEREEKVCLNCGTVLQGRYCHECGQENIEQHQPIGRVIMDFLDGFTYFDSKLFKTLKPLLFKPGFLTNEYTKGKRTMYLPPVKMYFFLSFLYFFIYFSSGFDRNILRVDDSSNTAAVKSVYVDTLNTDATTTLDLRMGEATTVKKYDSLQSILPPEKRDGFFFRWFSRKLIAGVEKSGGNPNLFGETLNKKYRSNLPQLVFLLMPLTATFLMLFYRRKKIFFIDHLVFWIHLHSFVFLGLTVIVLLRLLLPDFGSFAKVIFIVILLIYVAKALKSVYGQKWGITITKLFGLGTLYGLFLVIALVINSFLALIML